MFSKWMAGVVASLGLIGPASWTPKAEAGDFRIEFRSGSRYYGGYGYGGYGDYDYRGYGYSGYRAPAYSPAPVYYQPRPEHHYHVQFRRCPQEPWQEYGVYSSHSRAHEVEDYLEARGYETRMEHH